MFFNAHQSMILKEKVFLNIFKNQDCMGFINSKWNRVFRSNKFSFIIN